MALYQKTTLVLLKVDNQKAPKIQLTRLENYLIIQFINICVTTHSGTSTQGVLGSDDPDFWMIF